MTEELRSFLVGTIALDVLIGVAVLLTLLRGRIDRRAASLRPAVRSALLALLCQAAHFAEELGTGFHARYPELFGLAAWPPGVFVAFNLFWLAVWGASLAPLAAGRRLAFFPFWFLAAGCTANGLFHPLAAVFVAGYFPGLVTSPLSGLAGVLLLRHLVRATGTSTP